MNKKTNEQESILLEYIKPDKLEETYTHLETLSSKCNNFCELKNEIIAYIILQVKDNELEKINNFISEAIDILYQKQAIIDTVFSSIIFATFTQTLHKDINILQQCRETVNCLINSLGNDIRIVFGETKCLSGKYGNSKRTTFSYLIPNTGDQFNALTNLNFGEFKELLRV